MGVNCKDYSNYVQHLIRCGKYYVRYDWLLSMRLSEFIHMDDVTEIVVQRRQAFKKTITVLLK